jgi:TRAP-type C4-dicarboxylate transport system permease small subunit
MNQILSRIEKCSILLGYFSGALVFLKMVSIIIDVIMRHIFNAPTTWADEVSCYLLVSITFLGAAYTLNLDGHIRVEAIITKFNPTYRRHIETVLDIGSFLFLFFFAWQAFKLVSDSYTSVRIAPTLLRTPLYIPQTFFAVGLAWFALQLAAKILRRFGADCETESE